MHKKHGILTIIWILCSPHCLYSVPIHNPAEFAPGEVKVSTQTIEQLEKLLASILTAANQTSKEIINHSATEATKLTDHIEENCKKVLEKTTLDFSETLCGLINQVSRETAENLQLANDQAVNTTLRISLTVVGAICIYFGIRNVCTSLTSSTSKLTLAQGSAELLTGTGITATGYNLNTMLNYARNWRKK